MYHNKKVVSDKGKKIKVDTLEEELHIPVVPTVSTTGKGVDILKGRIEAYMRGQNEKSYV